MIIVYDYVHLNRLTIVSFNNDNNGCPNSLIINDTMTSGLGASIPSKNTTNSSYSFELLSFLFDMLGPINASTIVSMKTFDGKTTLHCAIEAGKTETCIC